ncbi:hypothetical protein FM103_17705 [Corynebacterium xerosis]|nr:hypothetical protein FM103_17705 [Corynebacterium xerosis]
MLGWWRSGRCGAGVVGPSARPGSRRGPPGRAGRAKPPIRAMSGTYRGNR